MTMRALLFLFLVFTCTNILSAQTLEEKVYKAAILGASSNAPNVIVVNVTNLNTGETKEMGVDATGLGWSMLKEHNLHSHKEMMQMLLDHVSDRTFEFRSAEALERLRFDTYKIKRADAIAKAIEKYHLVDSLLAYQGFRRRREDLVLKYWGKRSDGVRKMKDSILKTRPLTAEENAMVWDLPDPAGEYNHYRPGRADYEKLSDTGRNFLRIWKLKIEPYRQPVDDAEKEDKRQVEKFYDRYKKKYGFSFAHIAYKYGIISGYGDPDVWLQFRFVVTPTNKG